MVPSAIIWKWIYAPGAYGLANYLLDQMGFPRVGWMSTPQISLLAVIGIHVWKQLGFFVIVFLVGLKNIPASVREAAVVDGATPWQLTRQVDIPLLKPVILFCVVFGLPPLEAMACGTPVVTSRLSSLPEVVGDTALLVDTYSVEEISGAIERVLCDGALADDLRARGRERVARFSWERSVRAIHEGYLAALGLAQPAPAAQEAR